MTATQSKGTKPARKNRKARSAHSRRLTYAETQQAKRQAVIARQRRTSKLGRALHISRDPKRSGPAPIKTRLVREATAIVSADPGLVDWLADKLAATHRRPGRPRELTVRTALICFILQVQVQRSFLLSHLPELLATMTWRTRRNLGIDYLRNGQPTEVTYSQLLDFFHDMARAFDAWDDTLDELAPAESAEIRKARAADLQEFVDRIVSASAYNAPMWEGDAALDATLKWSHERPPNAIMNSKVERRGRDGDAGPAVPLSDVVAGPDGEIDRTQFTPVDPVNVTAAARTARAKRKTKWRKTWGGGSAWVGRANKTKSVHGIAMHSVVRTDPDSPCLIEGFTITPANGDPADAVMPVLRRLYDRRANDENVLAAVENGQAFILGNIVADPAYTAAGATRWQLPLKAMGANPVGRLHKTNQDGPRYWPIGRGKRKGEIVTIGGRPVCECVTRTPLAELRFPTFPYKKAEFVRYQAQIVQLARFEWKANGAVRDDGSRQYLAPHATAGADGGLGGCELCVGSDGTAAIGADGRPVPRCCTVVSRLVPKEVTALDMGVIHGSPEWYRMWNPRNRVEGSYGILKSLAVINYGRSFHHYVGLARETIVAAFAAIAYNVHMLAQWKVRQDLAASTVDADDPFASLPSAQPTETIPAATAARAAERAKPKTGPKGLSFLGRAAPDPT